MGLLWKPKLPAAVVELEQMSLFSPAVSAVLRNAALVLGQDVQRMVVVPAGLILIIVPQNAVLVVVSRSAEMLSQKVVHIKTVFARLNHRDVDY